MTLALLTRRSLVIIGVVAALVLGATSIRLAAAWTADAAPLEVAPATLSSLQSALHQEQTRSAALEEQLKSIEGAASDLSAALTTAQGQVVTDTQTADALKADLAAARTKLAALEAQLARAAAAAAAAARTVTTTSGTTGGPAQEPHDDGD